MKRAIAAFFALFAGFGGAAVTPLVAQQAITVHVECGPQGIVDDNHTVTVTVTYGSTDVSVSVFVPAYSDSGFIADQLAAKLNDACKCPFHPDEKFRTREVQNPAFPTTPPRTGTETIEKNKRENEDLVLHPCFKLKSIKTEREGANGPGGQLHFYSGTERIPNAPGFAPTPLTLTLDVMSTELPMQISLHLFQVDFDVDPETQNHVIAEYSTSYSVTGSGGNPLEALGQWIEEMTGEAVTYPTATSLQAIIPASFNINWAVASVREVVSASPEAATHTAEFSFDAWY
jgi:hypothetical protein